MPVLTKNKREEAKKKRLEKAKEKELEKIKERAQETEQTLKYKEIERREETLQIFRKLLEKFKDVEKKEVEKGDLAKKDEELREVLRMVIEEGGKVEKELKEQIEKRKKIFEEGTGVGALKDYFRPRPIKRFSSTIEISYNGKPIAHLWGYKLPTEKLSNFERDVLIFQIYLDMLREGKYPLLRMYSKISKELKLKYDISISPRRVQSIIYEFEKERW